MRFVLAFVLSSVLMFGCGDDGDSEPRNFSSFTSFSFSRSGDLDFCPPPDQVFRATITKRVSGEYEFSYSMLAPSPAGQDDCVSPRSETECWVEDPAPTRALTNDEVQRVVDAFTAVPVAGPHEGCPFVGGDSCLINSFEWDAETLRDAPCDDLRIPEETALALAALLDQLR
jgi:hypothetical protein